MLVLVSFGFVLLATILLVVGLLTDDGLTLIYFSIAASFTAAVVLFAAFRLARPKKEPEATAPSPLADDLAQITAPAEPAPAAAPATAVQPAVSEPEPAPVATPAPAADEDWTHDADWADEADFDVEFPIADYDDLGVDEIMPLLPQLYSDELEVVAERERAGKNRASILSRLQELAATGTEADALEAMATDEAASPAVTAAVTTPAATAPPSMVPPVSFADDGDDELPFPIADYDELTVAQIVPLLAQLEDDELEDVKAHEAAGQARKSLITEIDRQLGLLETVEDDTDWEVDNTSTEPAAATQAPPTQAPPTQAPPTEAASPVLAISGYDGLTVAQIRPLLADLDDGELRAVLEHEAARDNRRTIINEIERRLAGGREPAAPLAAPVVSQPATKASARTTKTTSKKAPSRKAPSRKAPSKRATATKATATKATSKKATSKKAASKRASAKRATKKKAAAPRFPISNYDGLTVAEIRPRLTTLSPAQLRQVREREASGAGRKTILNDIDGKLS